MKKVMHFYDSFKISIRVTFFAFALISIGFLIQNKNVNLFYTFKSSVILFIAELFERIGEFIVMNLPLIFMLNTVCKKANSTAPVVMALVGYFTFIVTTMLFSTQTLGSQAYITNYGINSIFNMSSGNRVPLETGMIGSLLVAYATRGAFILSRHRGNYSLTNFLAKDTAGIVYNMIFCFGIGIVISYVYPFIYSFTQQVITFISTDLSDPLKIGLYSVFDRFLSVLGLDKVIRYPFWFTSLGGSQQIAKMGQTAVGDVNIWTYAVEYGETPFKGAGRFITPYYVINMFMIPGFYLGTFSAITDKKDKTRLLLTFIGGILLSIIAGNPLPVELFMIFTTPVLFIFYLFAVFGTSYILVARGAFLGFETSVTNTTIAMPGSFPDFIINLRNINLSNTLLTIFIVGIITFVLMLIFTIIYYRLLSLDFANTGKGKEIAKSVILSVGGVENIKKAESGLLCVNLYLKNPEEISIEKVQEIGPKRVVETRDGISFEFGSSSYAIAKRINRVVNH